MYAFLRLVLILLTAVLISLFRKSKNRGNFVSILTANLFDEDTHMHSDIRGHGKENLDPEMMKSVKAQCFVYYPHKVTKQRNGRSVFKALM